MHINSVKQVKVFAPATVANVIVGFDLLGFAFNKIGDELILKKRMDDRVTLNVSPEGSAPSTLEENVVIHLLQKMRDLFHLHHGFDVLLKKGIPECSGLGGSAASSVAMVLALNEFLDKPLSRHMLAQLAMQGEAFCSGALHPDNVVPCLFGGLTLTVSLDPLRVLKLPTASLYSVIVYPHLKIKTEDARAILKPLVPRSQAVSQMRHLAEFIMAMQSKKVEALAHCLKDLWVEPERAPLLQGFDEVKARALEAGAFGMSFAGSGPSLIALSDCLQTCIKAEKAMTGVLHQQGIVTSSWVVPVGSKAAFVVRKSHG